MDRPGKAERFLRTITQTAKYLMFTSGCKPSWWSRATTHAALLYNLLLNSRNPDRKSAFEQINGYPQDLSKLRTWSSTAYVHIPKKKRTKFGKNTIKCAHVGMKENSDTYLF